MFHWYALLTLVRCIVTALSPLCGTMGSLELDPKVDVHVHLN